MKWQKRSTEKTTRRNQKWQTLFWYRCSYCCLKNVFKTVHIWWTTKHTSTAVYQLTYLCTFFVVHLFSSFLNKRRRRLQLAAFRKMGGQFVYWTEAAATAVVMATHTKSVLSHFSKAKKSFALLCQYCYCKVLNTAKEKEKTYTRKPHWYTLAANYNYNRQLVVVLFG